MRRAAFSLTTTVLTLIPVLPVDAAGGARSGSFVARALPFPAVNDDVYYLGKDTCLDGVDGIHKVSEPYIAPERGTLSVRISRLSGDWDLYALAPNGDRLASSEHAQLLDGPPAREGIALSVGRAERVEMVACNWLGEPEVSVRYSFKARDASRGSTHQGHPDHPPTTPSRHHVEATGGPVTPFWQWEPSDLEVRVGERVVWTNDTETDHHVTPYAGPWRRRSALHLPIGGEVDFTFRKPGVYLYRCDFSFAGVEHSVLVGDECHGMCGRIIVKKRG